MSSTSFPPPLRRGTSCRTGDILPKAPQSGIPDTSRSCNSSPCTCESTSTLRRQSCLRSRCSPLSGTHPTKPMSGKGARHGGTSPRIPWGRAHWTEVGADIHREIPKSMAVRQTCPNPVNARATIEFAVPWAQTKYLGSAGRSAPLQQGSCKQVQARKGPLKNKQSSARLSNEFRYSWSRLLSLHLIHRGRILPLLPRTAFDFRPLRSSLVERFYPIRLLRPGEMES